MDFDQKQQAIGLDIEVCSTSGGQKQNKTKKSHRKKHTNNPQLLYAQCYTSVGSKWWFFCFVLFWVFLLLGVFFCQTAKMLENMNRYLEGVSVTHLAPHVRKLWIRLLNSLRVQQSACGRNLTQNTIKKNLVNITIYDEINIFAYNVNIEQCEIQTLCEVLKCSLFICTQDIQDHIYMYTRHPRSYLYVHKTSKITFICTQDIQDHIYMYTRHPRSYLFVHKGSRIRFKSTFCKDH